MRYGVSRVSVERRERKVGKFRESLERSHGFRRQEREGQEELEEEEEVEGRGGGRWSKEGNDVERAGGRIQKERERRRSKMREERKRRWSRRKVCRRKRWGTRN